MLTLNEISKKAEDLYSKFESDYNQKFESELFTDDEIIELCKDGKFSGFIAIQSIVDCFYILRKVCSSDLYCIVTRNPKDYVSSSIDILTPKQFIDVIK